MKKGVKALQISYSIKEACTLTGIGQTKLYEAINKGLLHAKKYGRRTIILREDLELFLSNLEDFHATSQGISQS